MGAISPGGETHPAARKASRVYPVRPRPVRPGATRRNDLVNGPVGRDQTGSTSSTPYSGSSTNSAIRVADRDGHSRAKQRDEHNTFYRCESSFLVMRKLTIVGLSVLVAAVAAGCGGGRTAVRTVTVESKASAPSATGDQRIYGQIKSLVRRGDHFELRFDPAWFLSGLTANVAQARDQGARCRPSACPPVANDNYVVDEGHRMLTYVVPTNVRGSVLVKNGTNGGPFPSTTIAAAELARIVAGQELAEVVRAPFQRRLDPCSRRHGADVRPAVRSLTRLAIGPLQFGRLPQALAPPTD